MASGDRLSPPRLWRSWEAVACAGLLAAAVIAPRGSHAAVIDRPSGEAAAVSVDGWRVSRTVIDALQRLVQLQAPPSGEVQDPAATRADVVAALVRDRVLGEQAAHEPGDAVLFDEARVAFLPRASAEASLVAMLQQVYREPLRAAWPADGVAHFVVRRHALAPQRLSALLGAGPALRLDDSLTAAQQARLGTVPLLDYRLAPGARVQQVTLADVWQRLEVHGRSVLAAGDVGLAQQQAERLVQEAFVLRWVQRSGRLDAADLSTLRQLMLDHQRHLAWAEQQGAQADAPEPSEAVLRLQREVTPDEIARYYAAHREEFQRIERVHARHLRCADEACARAASDALAAGQPFGEVAHHYSVDAATRERGGELGWIDAAQAGRDWLAQFAFAQAPGAPSQAVRAPAERGAAGWEIVQVDERVMGMHAADSETVRFIAAQAVARQRAAEGFAQVRSRLLVAARVEVDVAALGVALDALRARGL